MRKLVKDRKFYLPFHMSKLEIKQNKNQVIDLTVATNKHSRSKAIMMAPWWDKVLAISACHLELDPRTHMVEGYKQSSRIVFLPLHSYCASHNNNKNKISAWLSCYF